MADDGLEARLRVLEDRLAIHQLFIDYGRHLDAGDFDAYAALFADEGEVLLGPMGRAKGPQAIKALMTKALAGQTGNSYHIISSPMVKLEGDRATSDVMWSVITAAEDRRPALTMVGRHVDDLVRERGAWKFLRRKGYVSLPNAIG
jgi:uncharacterized protein (TIGR02246 family)